MADMEPHKFKCWIYGNDVDNVFYVDTSMEETVAALKKGIKSEASRLLRNVDARQLDLYAIPSPSDEHLKDRLIRWKLSEHRPLEPHIELDELFPEPDKEWLIIVDAPSLEMVLWCCVHGEHIGRMFPIKISRGKTVADLRDVIKRENSASFSDIDADALVLYKVSLVYGEDVETTWDIEDQEPLHPLDHLSCVFRVFPVKGHVHIVVDVLPIEADRRVFLANNPPSTTPLSGVDADFFAARQRLPEKLIYCNRPLDIAAPVIPLVLLHPVFGQFVDDCKTADPTDKDYTLAKKVHSLSNDPSGLSRAEVFRRMIGKWGVFFDLLNSDSVTDGIIRTNDRCSALAHFGGSEETRTDPYFQPILQYLHLTRGYAATTGGSSLPCMMVLLSGPFLVFAGATWNLRPVVEPLGTVIPVCFPIVDDVMYETTARHLWAFKKAVRTIEEYYEGLSDKVQSSPLQRHLFPYRTHFTSLLDNCEQKFEYVFHPLKNKLVFSAVLSDRRRVSVKFVCEYSKEAHLVSASLGFTPTLHGFERLPGGLLMVVMDALPDDFVELRNTTPIAPIFERIREGLSQLHKRGYVHGDVRSSNIMVSKSDATKFMLLDFDWAGEIGKAKYPVSVRRDGGWRPEGVEPWAFISAEHDMQTLDHIIVESGSGTPV